MSGHDEQGSERQRRPTVFQVLASRPREESHAPLGRARMPAFVPVLFGIQAVIVVLYAALATYDPTLGPLGNDYGLWRDVHVMVFVGFGFLMTFLKSYSWSAVGFNFLVAAVGLQWCILVINFWERVFGEEGWHKIHLNLMQFIEGDFGAASILISMGAVLGRATPLQLVVMCMVEMVFYGLNRQILLTELSIGDIGGSLVIHGFGAFFGVAASWTLGPKTKHDRSSYSSIYHSDMFAMIGTMFLWMFWPSFNSAPALDDADVRHRTVINTILSMAGSCVAAFVFTFMFHKAFSMVDVQNATLAGGVAIGCCANMYTNGWGAIAIGFVGGFIATVGYNVLMDHLAHKYGIYDTCGVLNLHGLPGIWAAVVSILLAGLATAETYGDDALLKQVFPRRPEDGRATQAGFQAAGIFVMLAIAIVSGLLTGLLMKGVAGFGKKFLFYRDEFWVQEGDEEQTEDDKKDFIELESDLKSTELMPRAQPAGYGLQPITKREDSV